MCIRRGQNFPGFATKYGRPLFGVSTVNIVRLLTKNRGNADFDMRTNQHV